MDKTDILDDKKLQEQYSVHRLPDRIHRIHKDYGLWIFGFGNNKTPIDGFYRTRKRYFEFYSISHMYSGRGRLWLEPNREFEIYPGQCVITTPKTINRYGGADGECYDEDTISFFGPIADMLFKTGIIRNGVFELGKARLLLPIQELASDPSRDSQINANIALQKLLIDIYNENKKLKSSKDRSTSVIEPLLETLRENIDKWWTISEMAAFCSLSEDHFRRVFKKQTGMLPKIYIDRLKMQKASEMLISTDMKVAKVAEELHYHDYYHFSRRFKAVIGLSPRQYRRQFKAE